LRRRAAAFYLAIDILAQFDVPEASAFSSHAASLAETRAGSKAPKLPACLARRTHGRLMKTESHQNPGDPKGVRRDRVLELAFEAFMIAKKDHDLCRQES